MILLTGGTGYVGRHLTASLRACREEVMFLRHGDRVSQVEGGWQLDLAAPEHLARLPDLPATALVHLGGLIDIRLRPDPVDAKRPPLPDGAPIAPLYRANVQSTAALADFCRSRGLHLVLASSQTVYGLPADVDVHEGTPLRPLEPYAASKLAAEEILRQAASSGLAATVLRFPGVYGGKRRKGAVHGMIMSALLDRKIRVEARLPLAFDVLHVDDVVSGFRSALAHPKVGWCCFNLGSGEACSLTILASTIANLVPGCMIEPPLVQQPPIRMIVKAARDELGWVARPRAERLSDLIAHLRSSQADAA